MAIQPATRAEVQISVPTERDPRWSAVLARDRTADGAFFYSVATTGVYCVASCAARLPLPKNVRFHTTLEDAERAGFRACRRCRPDATRRTNRRDSGTEALPPGGSIEDRVDAIDWARAGEDLDARGWAMVPGLLSPAECNAIAGLYEDPGRFRSRVVMARHGFGRGEYQYFSYPLPDMIRSLRTAIYPHLAPVADRWNETLGIDARHPAVLEEFLARCHAAGQTLPTPLLLRYGAGDFNALHQDLYGEHVFPFQAAFLLSEPGRDFTGGEFILTEQRPRMQSRAEVVPLRQGDGDLRREPSAGPGDAGRLSRPPAAWGEPRALRAEAHRGRDPP